MSKVIVTGLILPVLTTFGVTFLLRYIAKKFEFVDIPTKRKIHREPIPLLGGIGIFLGISVGIYFNVPFPREFFMLFVGSTFILLINLIDDVRGLSPSIRFIVECVVSLLLIFSGIKVTFLPPGFWGNLGEIIITLLWMVGIANAFNYLDGMDGLAAGSAGINALYFAMILFLTKQHKLGILAMIFLGGCLGFLPHNFKRAKIFLGDAGSTFLGFFLAGLGILGNWATDNFVRITIPLLILGVPIFDMVFTTIMRFKEEKVKTILEWLRYSGKDHFHHYLVYLGLSPVGAVYLIWMFTISLGVSAVMIVDDMAWEAVLTLLQAGIIFGIIGVLMVVGRRKRSGWQKS